MSITLGSISVILHSISEYLGNFRQYLGHLDSISEYLGVSRSISVFIPTVPIVQILLKTYGMPILGLIRNRDLNWGVIQYYIQTRKLGEKMCTGGRTPHPPM